MRKESKRKTYDVDVVKMIRNNNMADRRMSEADGTDIYFMLDYFDLLFHKSLTGNEKVYRKFWHIESDTSSGALAYKASYKTLSLYAEMEKGDSRVWERIDKGMSAMPFLGVIQINIVYHSYEKEMETEAALEYLEQNIIEKIPEEFTKKRQFCYRMYRSSTSSDFCLIVRSNKIEDIFKIAMIFNNLAVFYEENKFNFSTYTNIGIECSRDKEGNFCTFSRDVVDVNKNCKFALRFTSSSSFANRSYKGLMEKGDCYLTDHMDGLFGRYDFMVQLTMEEFSELFPILCKSKVIGYNGKGVFDGTDSLVGLLQKGIKTGEIQIINERALVPLADIDFTLQKKSVEKIGLLKEDDKYLNEVVKGYGKTLWGHMNNFEELGGEFIEERRTFIDICRELREVINTYVPQGMDYDSHVNWHILISDLEVIFNSIKDWGEFYRELQKESEKKKEREHFLSDLRIATEAVNQYYKFLQNVNSQTWQSPIYEIQTQLDAEKMMIAYREFLYEYFCTYRRLYENRPMFYPIIYPDMSIDKVYVQAPFKGRGQENKKLLICKLPSFEYYGRMFNMIPWILHEASHSFRTMDRNERNEYLARAVLHKVFEQALYKVLNKYTGDFGYHKLGILEKGILEIIEKEAFLEFKSFCVEGIKNLNINVLQMKLLEFLSFYFDYDSFNVERKEGEKNREAIQRELLKYFKNLDLFKENSKKVLKECIDNGDNMRRVLIIIYHSYFRRLWGEEVDKEYSQIVVMDTDVFEHQLDKQIAKMKEDKKAEGEEKVIQYYFRDYCFTVRQMNRLYNTWYRRGYIDEKDKAQGKLWKRCIGSIRKKIENGFENNEGFTEIYRILNMVFGNGDDVSNEDAQRVEEIFDILSDEIAELIDREVAIYREACSDLYMTVFLGLDAFGYCRQSFQTTSDISVENSMIWEDGVNAHRFRTVTAVLLGDENSQDILLDGEELEAGDLYRKGKEYCLFTLECLKEKLLSNIALPKEEELIKNFIDLMEDNVQYLFECFNQEGAVMDSLDGSALAMFAIQGQKDITFDLEVREERERVKDIYRPIENMIDGYRHILYRINYFIYALAILGEKEKISVGKAEYEHMRKLYREYREQIKKIKKNRYCSLVAQYYNDPKTAASMSVQDMLDDTIGFIEDYYYRNRFKVMASRKFKREVEAVEKEKHS